MKLVVMDVKRLTRPRRKAAVRGRESHPLREQPQLLCVKLVILSKTYVREYLTASITTLVTALFLISSLFVCAAVQVLILIYGPHGSAERKIASGLILKLDVVCLS